MTDTKAKPGRDMEVAHGLEQLQATLRSVAPKLSPNTVSSEDAETVLSQLYDAESVKRCFLDSEGRNSKCSLCYEESKELVWTLEWDINILKRQRTPVRCLSICAQCYALRDLLRLVEQFMPLPARKPTNNKAVSLPRHFLATNGHDLANVHLFQDTISVAYAIFVINKELALQPIAKLALEQLFDPHFRCGNESATVAVKDVSEEVMAMKKKKRKVKA